jgi:hypothetical protein
MSTLFECHHASEEDHECLLCLHEHGANHILKIECCGNELDWQLWCLCVSLAFTALDAASIGEGVGGSRRVSYNGANCLELVWAEPQQVDEGTKILV